jgi:hypothetical protein
VGGVYCLVVPCDEVKFPGYVVGHFTGGEPLRAVLPKEKKHKNKEHLLSEDKEVFESSHGEDMANLVGYGIQVTWDVPEGKHNGMLDVRVCWHDIVYLAHVDFAKRMLVC